MGDKNEDADGYATEESEGDFVDVTEMKTWNKKEVSTPQKPEAKANDSSLLHPDTAAVQRSQTMRSSLKSPLTKIKNQDETKTKRTISFNLHDTTKPHVDIEPPKDEPLRNLFATSRWSSTSSDLDTPQKSVDGGSHLNTPTVTVTSKNGNDEEANTEIKEEAFLEKLKKTAEDSRMAPEKWKSQTLSAHPKRKLETEYVVKRRHSASEIKGTPVQAASLRDSAIDLISDDENSEAYTAVSLAGTLKRNAPPVHSGGIQRKHAIIGGVVILVVSVTIIVVLAVLLAHK